MILQLLFCAVIGVYGEEEQIFPECPRQIVTEMKTCIINNAYFNYLTLTVVVSFEHYPSYEFCSQKTEFLSMVKCVNDAYRKCFDESFSSLLTTDEQSEKSLNYLCTQIFSYDFACVYTSLAQLFPCIGNGLVQYQNPTYEQYKAFVCGAERNGKNCIKDSLVFYNCLESKEIYLELRKINNPESCGGEVGFESGVFDNGESTPVGQTENTATTTYQTENTATTTYQTENTATTVYQTENTATTINPTTSVDGEEEQIFPECPRQIVTEMKTCIINSAYFNYLTLTTVVSYELYPRYEFCSQKTEFLSLVKCVNHVYRKCFDESFSGLLTTDEKTEKALNYFCTQIYSYDFVCVYTSFYILLPCLVNGIVQHSNPTYEQYKALVCGAQRNIKNCMKDSRVFYTYGCPESKEIFLELHKILNPESCGGEVGFENGVFDEGGSTPVGQTESTATSTNPRI